MMRFPGWKAREMVGMQNSQGHDAAQPRTERPTSDVASLLARAASLVSPILAARGQSIVMGPMAGDVMVDRKPCRLVALIAAALQEMSGYTNRNGRITCMVLRHAVVLRGENPIIMPDSVLAADWLMLGRAKALGIAPQLTWDQGRGPVLTLIMPNRVPGGGNGAVTGQFALA
jgi:hypothetical protein